MPDRISAARTIDPPRLAEAVVRSYYAHMDLQSHKTARLTVLLAPEEKRQIERRARGLDLSVGEYVRRASQSYEPELDSKTLEALIDEWRANVIGMRATLTDALDHSDRCLAEARSLRAEHDGTG